MKLLHYSLIFVIFLTACSTKNEKTVNQETKNTKTATGTNNLNDPNDLTGIDTAAFFKKYPNILKEAKNTPFDTLSLKKKVLLMEGREYIMKSQFQLGSFGDQLSSFLRTNTGKTFDKNFTFANFKFEPGKSTISGKYDSEITAFGHATFSSVNLFFKINVNEKDPTLRKAKIESIKSILSKSKVDLSRVEYDEVGEPIGKPDQISIRMYQKLEKKSAKETTATEEKK